MTDRQAATYLIWQAAGAPDTPGDADGHCRLCGEADRGQPFEEWVKDSFTNYDMLRAGAIVCRACLFCADEQSTLIQQMKSRPKPQRFRTYSHFVVDGVWHVLTKGEKRQMRALLAQLPAVAIIAESGQKHLAFRAKAGWWQFEEQSLLPCWGKVGPLLPIIEELMTGFSKTEIESGIYAQYRIIKFGIERWRTLDAEIAAIRLAPYFQIALFLAQKEEKDSEA